MAIAAASDQVTFRVRRMGVDTYQESVIYLHRDCIACRSIGVGPQSRVVVSHAGRCIVATLNVVTGNCLDAAVVGFSEAAWRRLGLDSGEWVTLHHPAQAESASDLRAKIYGHMLDRAQYERLLRDAIEGRLSDIELAAFVTACTSAHFELAEVIALTEAMVNVGEQLHWASERVFDKHSVGGLPGNRTTPIVVAIVAAAGYLIPKTSSRAITSPAGTADAMATMTQVDLDLPSMRRVVELEGGCLVCGGAARLSPADDVLIRIERSLDLDNDAQLTASVLSKKKAAGATHVVLDIPVGPTAKVRSAAAAALLGQRLQDVAAAVGITAMVHISDGRQPVGRGIGPALEAWEVLRVLRNTADAPADLRSRALDLAAKVIEFDPAIQRGSGRTLAEGLLRSGVALRKFQAICAAQGGFREPVVARQRFEILAAHAGVVLDIDNRKLARLAKLAGAPRDAAAGLVLHSPLGTHMRVGEPILTLHADTLGELSYARTYFDQHPDIVRIGAQA